MAILIELDPQNVLANLDGIAWVERSNTSVDYYAADGKHTINYGSIPAAEAAVDAWLALVAIPAVDIEVGDQVKMSFPTTGAGSGTRTIEVEVVAKPDHPRRQYWLVKDTSSLFAIHEPVTISKPL